LYVCFLFCVFCVFVLFLILYIAVSSLFLYKITEFCHRVATTNGSKKKSYPTKSTPNLICCHHTTHSHSRLGDDEHLGVDGVPYIAYVLPALITYSIEQSPS